MVQDLDVARWRLRSQHVVSPFAVSAREAVGSLLAVQAENFSQAAWAVASRTHNPDQADLATLLDDGAVMRTHVLRPTWHFVLAEDIGWLLDLTGPRVRRVTGQQLRSAHGLDERSIDQAVAAVMAALASRGQLTRAQLADELRERGIPGSGQMLMILLAHAELDGLICSGGIVDGEHTYALMGERVPTLRRLGRTEALAELALRYFTGHGPATERDLAYWATLTLTDVRAGLQQVRDRLDWFQHDGRTFWHGPGDVPCGPQEPVGHLLQILDETYRGYQHSRWVLDAAGDVPRTSTRPPDGTASTCGSRPGSLCRNHRARFPSGGIAPGRTTGGRRARQLHSAAKEYVRADDGWTHREMMNVWVSTCDAVLRRLAASSSLLAHRTHSARLRGYYAMLRRSAD